MRRTRAYNLSLTGLAVAAVISIAFVLSLRWDYGYFGANEFMVIPGGIVVNYDATAPPSVDQPGWIWDGTDGFATVIFVYPNISAGAWWFHIYMPMWIPLLAVGVPSLIGWRRNRPPPPGHCGECGYNLAGLTSGRCPECGTKVELP